MLILNIKLAIRNLLKNKAYTFLIIGGFGIGFASCILIALFYRKETTVNNGFTNHKQIYRLYDAKKNLCNLNWDMFPILVSDFAKIDNACPLDYTGTMKLNLKDEQSGKYCEIRNLLSTTDNFFQMFSVRLTESNSGYPFDGNESVSISSRVAKMLYVNENPIGRKINLENYFYGTITSVFEELPVNSTFSADIILNSQNQAFRFSTNTTNGITTNPTNLFIQLKEGTSSIAFSNEVNNAGKFSKTDADSLALQGLDEIYLSSLTMKSAHATGNANLLRVFIGIGLLILILSSINYLNYSVSMQYARLRYTGIKKVFGAEWKNLAAYAVAEVATGIVLSLVFALLIADTALSYSDNIFGKALNISFRDCLAVAPFLLSLIIIVILFNSLGSVYILSKFSLAEFITGLSLKGAGKQFWKKALLAFQLTVTITMISIVIVIFSQLHSLMKPEPGFNREILLRINIPFKYRQSAALQAEIEKLPFVLNTAWSIGCPGMINLRSNSTYNDRSIDLSIIDAGDNYIKTMGLTITEGRDFFEGDAEKSCLLNEEAFRQLGWDKYQGNKFAGREVIGIVKDFRFASGHKVIQPLAIQYDGAKLTKDGVITANVLSIRLSGKNTAQQIDQLSKAWKSISPDDPFSYVFYDDFYKTFYSKEEKLASSITFFSLIALVLTCMGILGQIFMICLTRVKEVGIRKINGAKVSEILVLLNRDFLLWFVIAFVIAVPIATLISGKWLNNFAYRITLNWWLFAFGGLITLLILLFTVSWQSWKAATRNPVEALRYE